MKKFLSLSFLAMVIAIGHVQANSGGPESQVGMSVIKSGSLVRLYYRAEQSGNVKVAIYNDRNQFVFGETIRNTEQFMRPYNFSFLPEGNYTIELSGGNSKYTEKVKHSFSSNDTSIKLPARLARVSSGGNRYLLMVPNKGHNALTVKIFDERNNLLYNRTETIHDDFAKVYNLGRFTGNHTFEIVDSNGGFNRLAQPVGD
jgi:hypothetical protein